MPLSAYVNAHTHLELGPLAHLCPTAQPFTEWIVGMLPHRAQVTPFAIQTAIDDSIAALHAAGTVAVGDITATGWSVEPLLASGLRGVVYYEVLGLDPAVSLLRLAEAQGKINAWRRHEGAMRVGLTVHAPYSCAPALFVAATAWCIAENVPLAIHIAESPDEVAFLRFGTGPMADLNHRFTPHLVWDAPQCSPIQYLARLGVLAAKPLLIHSVQVDDADLATIKASGCAVVHCPRSNNNLLCGRMPLERYLTAGIPVALGTDSLASAQSLDIRDELAYAQALHGELVSESVLYAMATVGGLRALEVTMSDE